MLKLYEHLSSPRCDQTQASDLREKECWQIYMKLILMCIGENFSLNISRKMSNYFRYETKTTQEKCVDISLAVEMLYLSTVDAFDIAIIVSGDKDFVPALEKVRLLSKKVAICSMRNSCNTDLSRSDARIRDFDMIWLDDYIKELYEMKLDVEGNDVFDSAILSILVKVSFLFVQIASLK